MLSHEAKIVFVDERCAGSAAQHTDRNWDEHQSGLACAVAFSFLVDDGVCDEEHVQQSVQDAHVEGDEQYDGLDEQELKGPDQEDAESFAHWAWIEVELGDIPIAVQLPAELLRTASQDDRRVGLFDPEAYECPADS